MTSAGELRITIAVPVYATPPELLADCLGSIAASRGDADEVLVVVDGPQTRELEAVITMAPALGFRVIRHATRLGLLPNWNACLQLASLDLIHVMHADDAVAPEFHTVVRTVMAEHGVGVVAAGRVAGHRADAPREGGTGSRPHATVMRGRDAVRHLLSPYKPATGSFVLRARVLEPPARGFDPRFPHCPDEELFLRAGAEHGLGIVDDRLYTEARHARQARFATWHRSDFADTYYAARIEGASTAGIDMVPLAKRETSRRLLGVGRQLSRAGDARAARAIARSIAAHDKRSLIDWRYWALLGLAATAAIRGPRRGEPSGLQAFGTEADG